MSANKCFAYRYPGDRGEANPSQEPAQCPDLSDFARENKIRPQSNSHPTVSPAYRGGFQTDLCTRPQRAAYRRLNGGNARKCSEMSGNIEISAPNHHSRTGRNPAPANVRLRPQKTKSGSRAAIYQTACQPRKTGFNPSYQATAMPPPELKQRSEMLGNERAYEISAPNRHSAQAGTQHPEMSGYARKNQNPTSGPPSIKPCPSLVKAGSIPSPYQATASSLPPPECRQRSEMLGNEREYKISALNRHSRTGRNQPSTRKCLVTPAKNNPVPGPLQESEGIPPPPPRRRILRPVGGVRRPGRDPAHAQRPLREIARQELAPPVLPGRL